MTESTGGNRSLVGVFLGGMIALAAAFGAQFYQDYREAIVLRSALAGEMSAIIDIVEKRHIIEMVEDALQETEQQNKVVFPDFSVKGEYFNVYRGAASTGKLGSLKADVARNVATFYTYAEAITEDYMSLRIRLAAVKRSFCF